VNTGKHTDMEMDTRPTGTTALVRTLFPIVAVAFILFLVTGIALPVLPLHVHGDLGFSAFVVGLVAGAQFTAALLSRFWSGHYADSRGAKHATVAGLLLAVGAGLLYLLSLRLLAAPAWSVSILVLGRAVLGAAESCVVTGTLAWCLSLAGPQDAGKVMSWVGLAMYVALAIGAPAGTALYGAVGFGGVALATALIPLAGLALVARVFPVAPRATARPAFVRVVGAVWKPGLGLALSSIGFGAITTFVVLLFAQNGWEHAWLGLTLFFGTFVVGRLAGGHLPDRLGGARVALVSVVVEAAGQALIWLAPSAPVALLGAALSGFGYTLVYPGYGVEAVRRAPPESRGLAMGAYTAFLDLALGVASPILGLVASGVGVPAVFLFSALAVLSSAAMALSLAERPQIPCPSK
jgi:MFS family permease